MPQCSGVGGSLLVIINKGDKQAMSEDILRGMGLGLIVAISWYIPLREYAERIISKTKLVDTNWPPLLISYCVWYVPVLILILGNIMFNKFASCAGVTIGAILWAYIGHKWIQGQSLEAD